MTFVMVYLARSWLASEFRIIITWLLQIKACVITQSDIIYHVESSVSFTLPQPNVLLSDPNNPNLVTLRSLPNALGLASHPAGLLVWGENGLALENLEAGTSERLLAQPISAVETLGQEILAAGPQGILAANLGER